MLDYIRLVVDDETTTLHETATRAVARAEGFVGIAPVRQSSRPKPQRHGSINRSRWVGERVYTVDGECWGDTPGDAEDEYGDIAAALFATLDPGTPGRLEWQLANGGLELQAEVKLGTATPPPLAGGAPFLQYQASLLAEDPRAYSQTETTAPGSPLSGIGGGKIYPYTYPREYNPVAGGNANLVVAGQAPTPPVLRVYGYCTSPQIVLESTGETIALTGVTS
jgi:hypothetical protein